MMFDTELRAEGEDMTVSGYALKFDKETQIGPDSWGWKEKISKQAMNSADMSNVILNFNHSFDSVLARTTNGSLTLRVDGIGLWVEAKIVDTATGRDVYKLIKDGLINRMSFQVQVKKSEWEMDETGKTMDIRTITEFGKFYDVSAVTFPAYEDTSISARDDDAERHFKEKETAVRNSLLEELDKLKGDSK